ncbi:uncharacterized protein LOC131300038 isoform X4 [Rhododendron vialii]|uniref:uncharacterized protein LOC131300038 isoform X3 n=1 Tax=Rhododendron vialii TaxID=182163 RepID=UPI00265F9880|nr:uncharacterized protein LOC131300038 isoform X3 [Rhododendron vialii]XP_058181660.1 uncharacterized protein LOC131300038 isoform X4 [Rhododendron vialii]
MYDCQRVQLTEHRSSCIFPPRLQICRDYEAEGRLQLLSAISIFICHIHSEDVTALQVQADLCKNLRSVGLDVDHFTFPEGIPGVLETSFSKYSHQHALV